MFIFQTYKSTGTAKPEKIGVQRYTQYEAATSELLTLNGLVRDLKVAIRTDRPGADAIANEIRKTVDNSATLKGYTRITHSVDAILNGYKKMPRLSSDWSTNSNASVASTMLFEKTLDDCSGYLVSTAFQAGLISRIEAGKAQEVAEFLNKPKDDVAIKSDFLMLVRGYLNRGDLATATSLLKYSFEESTQMVAHPLKIDPEMPYAFAALGKKDLSGDAGSIIAISYPIDRLKPKGANLGAAIAGQNEQLPSIGQLAPFFKPIELDAPEKNKIAAAFAVLDAVDWKEVGLSLIPGVSAVQQIMESIKALKEGNYEKMALCFAEGLAYAALDVAALATGGVGKAVEAMGVGARALSTGTRLLELAEEMRVIAKAARAGALTTEQTESLIKIGAALRDAGAELKATGSAIRKTGFGLKDLKTSTKLSGAGAKIEEESKAVLRMADAGAIDAERLEGGAKTITGKGNDLVKLGTKIEATHPSHTLENWFGSKAQKPVEEVAKAPELEKAFLTSAGEGEEYTKLVGELNSKSAKRLAKLKDDESCSITRRVMKNKIEPETFMVERKGNDYFVFKPYSWERNREILAEASGHVTQKMVDKVGKGAVKADEKLGSANSWIGKETHGLYKKAGENFGLEVSWSPTGKVFKSFDFAIKKPVFRRVPGAIATDVTSAGVFGKTEQVIVKGISWYPHYALGVTQVGLGTSLGVVGVGGVTVRTVFRTMATGNLLYIGGKMSIPLVIEPAAKKADAGMMSVNEFVKNTYTPRNQVFTRIFGGKPVQKTDASTPNAAFVGIGKTLNDHMVKEDKTGKYTDEQLAVYRTIRDAYAAGDKIGNSTPFDKLANTVVADSTVNEATLQRALQTLFDQGVNTADTKMLNMLDGIMNDKWPATDTVPKQDTGSAVTQERKKPKFAK